MRASPEVGLALGVWGEFIGPYRGGRACDIFHNLCRDFVARTIRTCPRAGGVCAPAAPIPLIDHGH